MNNRHLNFVVFFAIDLVHFVVSSSKYEYISDCNFSPWCREVTFICDTIDKTNYIFRPYNFKCSDGVARYYNIDKINFQNCMFNDINADFLKNFTQLQEFDASNVRIKAVTITEPVESPLFKRFDASFNQLTSFPNKLFCSINSLIALDLSYNSIEHIGSADFDCAKNLINLNLSHNQLLEIPSHLFISSMKLELIDFSSNAIKQVHRDAFMDVNHVASLDLSNNSFESIENHLFDSMSKLKYLNLSYNPIGNFKIETFAYLTELEHLDLRRTNISSIALGTFSFQSKLISLDLSGNKLRLMDFSLFLPALHHLKALRIADNQLQGLFGFENALFPQLAIFDIKNNQFTCEYLKNFIKSINWDSIEIPLDPNAIDVQKTNIRGINCETTLF